MRTNKLIAFVNHQTQRRTKPSRGMDWPLLVSLALLCLLGLINLYSANPTLCFKQGVYMLIGWVLLQLLCNLTPETLYRWTPYLYTASLILLTLVLALGLISKGAQRWLHLGVINLQPSELTKLTVPMMLSWRLQQMPLPPSLMDTCRIMVFIAIPAGLVFLQPDLGTTLIVIAVGIGVLVLSGLAWRYFAMGLLACLLALPILWHHMHDYQKDRVLTFLNPEQDPLGKGYHIIQSKIAIGSGGITGKGWHQGSQAHLNFLPEHSTDFVFSLWGEEFGFIGSLILMALFAFITWRLLLISQQANNTFARLLSGSFAWLFILSCAVNLGMVMGLLPVVGVPLPFMSYGGSHLLTWFLALGIAMAIYKDKKLMSS